MPQATARVHRRCAAYVRRFCARSKDNRPATPREPLFQISLFPVQPERLVESAYLKQRVRTNEKTRAYQKVDCAF